MLRGRLAEHQKVGNRLDNGKCGQKYDPDWNGLYVRAIRTMDTHHIALVEFIRCFVYQFGGPNDELITGHRLWRKRACPLLCPHDCQFPLAYLNGVHQSGVSGLRSR